MVQILARVKGLLWGRSLCTPRPSLSTTDICARTLVLRSRNKELVVAIRVGADAIQPITHHRHHRWIQGLRHSTDVLILSGRRPFFWTPDHLRRGHCSSLHYVRYPFLPRLGKELEQPHSRAVHIALTPADHRCHHWSSAPFPSRLLPPGGSHFLRLGPFDRKLR